MDASDLLEWLSLLLLPIGAVIKLVAIAFLTRLAVIAADKVSKKLEEDNKDPP